MGDDRKVNDRTIFWKQKWNTTYNDPTEMEVSEEMPPNGKCDVRR